MKGESRQMQARRMRKYNASLRKCIEGKNREKVTFDKKIAENVLVVIVEK